MRRRLLRWAGIGAYLGVLFVILAVTSYVSFSRFVRRGVVSVPPVVGHSEVEALSAMEAAGLRLERTPEEDRFDDEIPAGHVVRTDPPAGSRVKAGSRIDVLLSRGRQLVAVPSVVGQPLQAAQVNLSALGLTIGRRASVFWPVGEPGSVIRQAPEGSTEVENSSAVDLLVVAENPEKTFVMPDLIYLKQERVRAFFESRGFRLGRVKYETYEGVEPGTVLRQYPLPGYPVRSGDSISLVVTALEEAAT